MKALVSLFILLLASYAVSESKFCPKSKQVCPNDRAECINKFWKKYGSSIEEGIESTKKKLPLQVDSTTWWGTIHFDKKNRYMSNGYLTNEKENKRRDKVPIPADMRLIGPCNSEKGVLCTMPGLTFRMFVMNEHSKVIVDKTYTRKDCAWLENILDPFQYK